MAYSFKFSFNLKPVQFQSGFYFSHFKERINFKSNHEYLKDAASHTGRLMELNYYQNGIFGNALVPI